MLSLSFFLIAVPIVFLIGLSKGGFGGGLALIGVPILSLFIDPRIAAAILLPILCVMDAVGLFKFKGQWHFSMVKHLIPGAMFGTVLGALSFNYTNADLIRFSVGLISIYFVIHYFITQKRLKQIEKKQANAFAGSFWGTLSGFASYIAHAGGPPVAIYLVPQKLSKGVFASTTILFFAIVNYVKLVPYIWYGQINGETIMLSALLMPIAPLGVIVGNYLHHRVNEGLFYTITCLFLLLAGIKLSVEGLLGLIN